MEYVLQTKGIRKEYDHFKALTDFPYFDSLFRKYSVIGASVLTAFELTILGILAGSLGYLMADFTWRLKHEA